MNLIVLFTVCICLAWKCATQDITDAVSQTSTYTSTSTPAVDWDTTVTPAHKRRTMVNHQRFTDNADYTVFADNLGPMLMPMHASNFGSRLREPRRGQGIPPQWNPFFGGQETFALNETGPDDRQFIPSGPFRYPVPEQYVPYPPMLFYPPPIPPTYGNAYHHSPRHLPNAPQSEENEGRSYPASQQGSPAFGLPRLDESAERLQNPISYFPPQFLRNRGGYSRQPVNAVYRGQFPTEREFFQPPSDMPSDAYPQVDIFVRPPYDDGENVPKQNENLPRKEAELSHEPVTAAESMPAGQPNSVEVPPPAVAPRSQTPVNPFGYGYLPIYHPALGLPPRPVPHPNVIPSNLLPNLPIPGDSVVYTNAVPQVDPTKPVDTELPDNLPPPVPKEIVDDVRPVAIPDVAVNRAGAPYEFGYDMNDGNGTDQHRQESGDEAGVVTGSYGYRDAFGVYRMVNYIADKNGFRAFVKSNEPGVANPGSADVIVLAERPPLHSVIEGIKATQPSAIEVPDEAVVVHE